MSNLYLHDFTGQAQHLGSGIVRFAVALLQNRVWGLCKVLMSADCTPC